MTPFKNNYLQQVSLFVGAFFFLIISFRSVTADIFYPTRTFCISMGYELSTDNAYFPKYSIVSADYSIYYRHFSFRAIGSFGETKTENDWPLSSDTIKTGSKLFSEDFSILIGYIQQIEHGNFLTFYLGPDLSLINYLLTNKIKIGDDFLPYMALNLCVSGNIRLTDLTDSHAGLAIRPDVGIILGNFDELSKTYISGKIYCSLGISFIITKDKK